MPISQWSPAPSASVKVTNSFGQTSAFTSCGALALMSSLSALQTKMGTGDLLGAPGEELAEQVH